MRNPLINNSLVNTYKIGLWGLTLNTLPNNKNFVWSKLKAFADSKINVI